MSGVAVRPSRVRFSSVLTASLRRDLSVGVSYRLPFVLDLLQRLAGLVVLYFLGRVVDGHVDGLGAEGQQGYFGFVLIGMLVLGLAATSLSAYAERLRADQATGTIEAVLAMPCPTWLTMTSNAAYDLVYMSVITLVSLAFSLLFLGVSFHVTPVSGLAAVVALVALLALTSSVGIAFAAFSLVFKRGGALVSATTTALTVLGGIYYPVAVLPSPLRQIGAALPFTWGVQVLRESLLTGRASITLLAGLVAAALASVPTSLVVLRVALDRARRTGTLTQF